jgi:HK97 gp10 family phage protein
MSISVSVDTSKLDAIIAKLPGNRDKIIKAAAFHILGEARKRAPVATGALRDNSEVVNGDGYTNVEFRQEYAAYVELGTHKMAAQPFLTPAVEAEAKLLEDRIKEGLIQK